MDLDIRSANLVIAEAQKRNAVRPEPYRIPAGEMFWINCPRHAGRGREQSVLDAPDRAIPGEKRAAIDVALPALDLLNHPVQITAGIDAIKARAFDQAIVDRPSFCRLMISCEQRVLFRQGDATDTALDRIVVDLDPAVEDKTLECFERLQRIVDRLLQQPLRLGCALDKFGTDLSQNGQRLFLAQLFALIRRKPACDLLNRIHLADQFDDLVRERALGCKMSFKEIPPTVSFGAYAMAAWLMGLTKNLEELFSQERDPVFQREARLAVPQKVRKKFNADENPDG